MRYCPRCWWLFDMAAGALACYLLLSIGAPQTIRCAVGGNCGIHVAGGAVSACAWCSGLHGAWAVPQRWAVPVPQDEGAPGTS